MSSNRSQVRELVSRAHGTASWEHGAGERSPDARSPARKSFSALVTPDPEEQLFFILKPSVSASIDVFTMSTVV